MVKKKENRKIPDLIINQVDDETPFDAEYSIETEDYTCFGVTKKDTRCLVLKVIYNNGGITLIHYSKMVSPIIFNGSNAITIDTPRLRLVMKGMGLKPLMGYIAEQRLAWVKVNLTEGSSDFLMMRRAEPDIKNLEISQASKKEA